MHSKNRPSLFDFFSRTLRLPSIDALSYEEEKKLSASIDEELGIRFLSEASDLSDQNAETWNHLSPQIFQTPYPELCRMIEEVDPGGTVKTWVDLGAGYGRLGLLVGAFRPGAQFIGIEIDKKRVREAKRIYQENNLNPASMRQGDCERDPLPSGEVYLIYDFGHRQAVELALEKLRVFAKSQPLRLIGRGRRVRDLIEKKHPWLGSVFCPVHHTHYSIYRTDAEKRPEEE